MQKKESNGTILNSLITKSEYNSLGSLGYSNRFQTVRNKSVRTRFRTAVDLLVTVVVKKAFWFSPDII